MELGTHHGASFLSFCQAVQENDLKSSVYAVDTWQGDEHAGFYDDSVFQSLKAIVNKNYFSFAHLLRMTFDEALPYFSNGEVDLLHIDGLHTYEAVKHDFDSWLPKISEQGVVLLHDTEVRERNFGVWRLMQEVSSSFKTFNFRHGYGLGIVIVGKNVPSDFLLLCEALEQPVFYQLFERLGYSIRKELELLQLIEEKEQLKIKFELEINNLKQSYSFKIGRLITWPIRKIRNAIS
ncbi:MAG: class I SAM-dependent methyltransferase [Patescibacteria group bacterium]|nr:class I SAM-dependent methyltransferase [Patescibacteria group bacterium]